LAAAAVPSFLVRLVCIHLFDRIWVALCSNAVYLQTVEQAGASLCLASSQLRFGRDNFGRILDLRVGVGKFVIGKLIEIYKTYKL